MCVYIHIIVYMCCVFAQHQFEEVNSTIVQSCVKSLSVSVGTLAQLVTNFCQSYETELQPWVCDRHLSLGPLGPLCKRAASHWDHICKVCNKHMHMCILSPHECYIENSWNFTAMTI